MNQTYLIGKILRPRGLKGELKVQILTNITTAFTNLKTIYIGKGASSAELFNVLKSSVQNGFAYLLVDGVATVEKAENFREKQVFVGKEALAIGADEVLEIDLLGFEIVDLNGKKLGILKSIENYGGSDFLNLGIVSGEPLEIPYEDEFIIETNKIEKKIIVSWDTRGERA